MRKQQIDNMAAYLSRKEERIRLKQQTKITAEEEEEEGLALAIQPAKLVKLDSSSDCC